MAAAAPRWPMPAPRSSEWRERLPGHERPSLDPLMKSRDAREGLHAPFAERAPTREHR